MKVITFGCNDEGALGRDTSVEESETTPDKVNIDGCVVQITAGDSHTAALLSDGRVLAWGSFRVCIISITFSSVHLTVDFFPTWITLACP